MPAFRRCFPAVIFALFLVATCAPLMAQTLMDVVPVGDGPSAIAVNPATNLVYISNWLDGGENGTLNVLDASNDTIVATLTVGVQPRLIAVNPLTNRIYVLNGDNTVTFVDGSTNHTASIPVGEYPWSIAVNTLTNKIYVTSQTDDGYVTVIDGNTNLTTTISTHRVNSQELAINIATNRIYVCNWGDSTISVLDGATQTKITDIAVGNTPNRIAVNSVTNKVYVSNQADKTVSVVDGGTNRVVATLPLSDAPTDMAFNPVTGLAYIFTEDGKVNIVSDTTLVGTLALPFGETECGVTGPFQHCNAVDPVTNKIYYGGYDNNLGMIDGNNNTVTSMTIGNGTTVMDMNLGTNRLYVADWVDNTVSVLGGAKSSPMQWYSVAPCRVFDSRPPHGNGPILGGLSQHIFVPQTGCNIPATATAYSLNVTVVPRGQLGYLTIWPSGEVQPYVSTMNAYDGRVKANAAIVPAGASGGVDVYVTNTTDVILDIDGYFAPPSLNSSEFFPLAPCRVLDTRNRPNGPLAGPRLEAGQVREFPILQSPCLQGINNPQAYSFNVSVVPNPGGQRLNYLTIWPADQQQPTVSTLNNPTATVVANGAIVPASAINGDIRIYTYNSTDVFVDINGYFGAPDTGGLSMYPLAPCRVLDTRQNHGLPFQGTLSPPINVAGSPCAPDNTAQTYIFNATVVPRGSMGYLTLWPDGEQMPLASTLNAYDGWVTSNMAIVQTRMATSTRMPPG